ncbi:ABC transporter permease [Pseudalkalibacillus hwajinpoensis]|uniref:ABC transporter permease n=1 Tax=Guptibacillus hwajinpoensis TaxID=208199 RepID=UPI00325AD5D6
MIAYQLFRKRVDDDRRYKLRTISSALDWTVWLYILIPGLVISVAYYRSWWLEAPEWLSGIPEQAAVIPLYMCSISWALRVYSEDADQVYLLQNKTLMNGLKRWGILYSLGKGMLITAIGVGAMLPLLLTGWGWGLERSVLTGVFLLLVSWNGRAAHYFIELAIPSIWIRWLPISLLNMCSIGLVLVVNGVIWRNEWLVLVTGVCLLLLLVVQLKRRLTIQGTFFHDVVKERGYKQNITKILLGNAASKPLIVRTKPFLFQNSTRLFKKRDPEIRILDVYVKWLLRSAGKMQFYAQVVGWSSAAIVLLPAIVKVIVLLFSLYALIGLSKADWREFSEGNYARLFQWRTELLTGKQGLKVVTAPCFLLLCVTTGIAFPGWATIILFPITGWFLMNESLRIVNRTAVMRSSWSQESNGL